MQDAAKDLLRLHFSLERLEREETFWSVVGAAADVAAHDYTTVDVLTTERAVGVDRVADQSTHEPAHGADATAAV